MTRNIRVGNRSRMLSKDIPDSLRRELLTKPMSLFEDSGEAGKAAAIARQIEQKNTFV